VLRQASNDLADSPQGVRLLATTMRLRTDRQGQGGVCQPSSKVSQECLRAGGIRPVLLEVKDFATAQTVVTGLMKKNGKDPQVAVLNGIVLLQQWQAE
jgi:hypothetical protein